MLENPRTRRQLLQAFLLVVAATALLVLAPLWLRPEPNPRDAVYFVLVDRFADGTPDPPGTVDRTDPQAWHGGDLQGVRDHLDWIAGLGVGAIWLSPVSDARTEPHGPWGAYHGYWVEDLAAIEPRFGTMEELRALVEEAHRRKIRVYLDLVYNHVAPDGALLREHPEWFHGLGDIVNWDDPEEIVTHDVHGLPDLAQEDEAVYAHLREASLAIVDAVHPDGFRVDAVRHLPAGFLARLGDELRAHQPGFELLGEVYDGSVDRVAERARADRLDAVFDFPLAFAIRDVYCRDAPPGRVASLVRADYGGARPVTLVDNHDLPRIASLCGDRAPDALAFLLSARGTPSLTYGTEIGLQGMEEPANRGDMDFDAPIVGSVPLLLAARAGWPSLRSAETRVVGLSPSEALYARLGEQETALIGDQGWRALVTEPAEVVTVGRTRLARYAERVEVPAGTIALTISVDAGSVLVGAGPRLGGWDPARGVRAGDDGRFHLEVPDGEVLACKLVRVRDDGSFEWEAHPDRYLLVTSDRWTGPGECGQWCAPAVDGAATFTMAWADRPLLGAVEGGQSVAELLVEGADPRATHADGRTAVEVAVDAGNAPAFGELLAAGGRPSPDLLVRAVRSPNPALLEPVLALGLPIDQPDAAGVTPLQAALEARNLAAVDRLRALGADRE